MTYPPAFGAPIDAADAYLDAAPRPDADAVDAGAFTLFVSRTPWSYYARPRRAHRRRIKASDLDVVAATCESHGVEISMEWVCDLQPELAAVAAGWGLEVRTHALMVVGPADVIAPYHGDVRMRIVDAEEPALLVGRSVADVSFAHGGTQVAPPGLPERDAAVADLSPTLVEHLRSRAGRGLTITAVAELEGEGVVSVGSYQPIGPTAELLAIATLPSFRRRGIAAGLTSFLVGHAATNGVSMVLLSAEDDDVARIYRRVGFTQVATAGAANSRD